MNIIIALNQIAINLFFLGLFCLGFLGSGQRILKWILRDKKLSFEENLLFSLGLGIGFFEVVTLLIGFLGFFAPSVFWTLLIFTILFTNREWRRGGGRLWQKTRLFYRSAGRFPPPERIILGVVVLRLGINFLAAQAPVTEGDALWYHLTLPRIFIHEGRIIDAHYLSSYLTFNTEMLYTWAMLLKDEILAQLLSFLVGGIFLTTAVYFFTKKVFSPKLAPLASFIFVLSPLVSWESVTPKVELFWAFFVLLSFWAVINWLKSQKKEWLFLAGIFLGLNFGTKGILGAIPFLALIPIFIWGFWRSKKKIFLVRQLLIFGLVVLAFYAPYLIRNYWLTRNPFFPFLVEQFGAGGLDVGVLKRVHLEQYPQSLSLPDFLVSLWKISMFPVKYNGDIGPFWFVFIPIGLILFAFKKKSRAVWLAFCFSLTWYPFWYWRLFHSNRYLLPIFPFASILVAATVVQLFRLGRLTRFLTTSILVISVPMSFLTYFWTFEPYGPKLKTALGIYDRRTYILKMLPYVEDFFWINENLPQEARVLLYLNPWQRTFYLDRSFILATQLQREIDFKPGKIKSIERFLSTLKNHEITYVYGLEIKSEDEGYLQGLLYWLQNPPPGEKYLEKVHSGVLGFGNVYRILFPSEESPGDTLQFYVK